MSMHEINIEKYDFDSFDKEQLPYTMIPNNVIQNMTRHAIPFAIWTYLQSLPKTWKINKTHIMQMFDIKERTYQKYMAFLVTCSLIRYQRKRLPDGTLGRVTIIALNGTKFSVDAGSDQYANKCIVDSDHTAKKPQCGENAEYIKTIDSKEEKEKKTTNYEEQPKPQNPSSSIFSENIETQMLQFKLDTDSRTDEEFLEEVKHHVDNNSYKNEPYLKRQRLAVRLLRQVFEEQEIFKSTGFISKRQQAEQIEKAHQDKLEEGHKLYWSQFINDRDFLKIASVQGKEPLSFKEWVRRECSQEKNASEYLVA